MKEEAKLDYCGDCTNITVHKTHRYPCDPETCYRYKGRKSIADAAAEKAIRYERERILGILETCKGEPGLDRALRMGAHSIGYWVTDEDEVSLKESA